MPPASTSTSFPFRLSRFDALSVAWRSFAMRITKRSQGSNLGLTHIGNCLFELVPDWSRSLFWLIGKNSVEVYKGLFGVAPLLRSWWSVLLQENWLRTLLPGQAVAIGNMRRGIISGDELVWSLRLHSRFRCHTQRTSSVIIVEKQRQSPVCHHVPALPTRVYRWPLFPFLPL